MNMAVISEVQKVGVSLKLSNGTNPETGVEKTVSVSLGSLNKNAFDAQKAKNIANALMYCLAKASRGVYKSETTLLIDD